MHLEVVANVSSKSFPPCWSRHTYQRQGRQYPVHKVKEGKMCKQRNRQQVLSRDPLEKPGCTLTGMRSSCPASWRRRGYLGSLPLGSRSCKVLKQVAGKTGREFECPSSCPTKCSLWRPVGPRCALGQGPGEDVAGRVLLFLLSDLVIL